MSLVLISITNESPSVSRREINAFSSRYVPEIILTNCHPDRGSARENGQTYRISMKIDRLERNLGDDVLQVLHRRPIAIPHPLQCMPHQVAPYPFINPGGEHPVLK